MVNRKLGEVRLYFCCSSSIRNFKEKIEKSTGLPEWNYNPRKNVVFFGMYHILDYLKFLWCQGEKKVFWCGSDILNLGKWRTRLYAKITRIKKAENFCENEVEQEELKKYGIEAKVNPVFFGDVDLPETYRHSENPHIWLCMHKDREREYGIVEISVLSRFLPEYTFHIYGIEGYEALNFSKNVVFHGKIPEKQLDEEIKNYQCGLRLNSFDGFSEVIAKSILLGQYPISKIKYPHLWSFDDIKDLKDKLLLLKKQTKPNPFRKIWKEKLIQNLKFYQ